MDMSKRNVLLLFSDQHRGDWLPGENSIPELRMPNIRALMDRGTAFTNCVTPSPLCAPARACLAFGDDYDHCGTYNNRFCMPIDRPTIYSILRDAGYRVGNAGKLDLHKPCLYWGKDGWLSQLERIGFTDAVDSEGKWDALWASYHTANGPYGAFLRDHGMMEAYARDYTNRFFDPMTTEPTDLSDEAYADNYVTETAIQILDGLCRSGQPWFMTVNFSGPHDPWDITQSMKASVKDRAFPPLDNEMSDCEPLRSIRQNYAAMLENIDRNIGKLLKRLKESGQYDETLIVYSADHGEMLGDRNQFYKSKPYRASVHIPLILAGEGIRRGARVESPTQLQDVSATIVNWCGAALPADRDGKSLLKLAADEHAAPIRTCQISKLSKSVQSENSFFGYEEYAEHEKTMTDRTFFSGICNDLHIPWREIPAVNCEQVPDWACVIAEGYKLILFANGRKELYRTDDFMERTNLAEVEPALVRTLTERYGLSVFRKEEA